MVCSRDSARESCTPADLERCAALASPDNIAPHPVHSFSAGAVRVAVINPVRSVLEHDGCVCLGHLFGAQPGWWRTLSEEPDGSYAILRHDERYVELVTDMVASRTLWYALTDEVFLVSTSQRALVALLGSFELNEESVAWMLATGHLGPGLSWDRRLAPVPAGCRLTLDRARWRVALHRREVPIAPTAGRKNHHIEGMRDAIYETCASLDLDMSEWLLPLSGGMDSRVILLGLLAAGKSPHCITWGLRSSLLDRTNDAFIARELATELGVEHEYVTTEPAPEGFADALARFILVAEGRVENFGGYTDGLAIWRDLFERGICGVIRGDEVSLGYGGKMLSDAQCRFENDAIFVSDYPPTHPIRRLALAPQQWPDELHRRPDESLAAYDGRLEEHVLVPTTLSALNDLKSAYVELVNPLISRRIMESAHRLPKSLRQHRASLREVLSSVGPALPFAETSAIARPGEYLEDAAVRAEMLRGLSSTGAQRLFSDETRWLILAGLNGGDAASRNGRVQPLVKRVVPHGVKRRVKPVPTPRLSGPRLAFRAYIAAQIVEVMSKDAAALR